MALLVGASAFISYTVGYRKGTKFGLTHGDLTKEVDCAIGIAEIEVERDPSLSSHMDKDEMEEVILRRARLILDERGYSD